MQNSSLLLDGDSNLRQAAITAATRNNLIVVQALLDGGASPDQLLPVDDVNVGLFVCMYVCMYV